MRLRPGLALLIVVGVLGILAVLAAAFVTMAQLERRASRQRLNATKAELLARSGIEDALARLGAFQDADEAASRYLGEDWDASGALDGLEAGAEVYRPGQLDVEACPAKQALRPSFYVRDPASVGADGLKAPRRARVEGRERGYTGGLAGDQASGGNQYALKVTPLAGIWVNAGSPAGNPGYDTVLQRILGTLAEAMDRENGGANDGAPVDQTDGENLVVNRPGPGWTGWEQVRDVALGGDQGKLDALKPYLTRDAWVDTRTLKPDTGAMTTTESLHTWSEVRQGVNAAYRPTRGVPVLEPRAPVNLAWARRRWPVLVALMGGLKGLYLDERQAANGETLDGVKWIVEDYIGRMTPVELVLDWSQPADPCRDVATTLVGYTGPLDTWDGWNAFCDTLTTDLGSNAYPTVPAMRSLLKANFNPNSRLNKFNPNRAMWHMVDKQDLLPDGYSTEFVLEPVYAQELESVGRVLSPDGRLLASRTLVCEVSGPEVVRLSTQREFVCSDLGSLDRSGDEAGVRIPGAAADAPFLPASQGPGTVCTWGQELPGLSGKGLGVQSYPEPYVDLDTSSTGWDLALSPADYDGSLQQATLETEKDYAYMAGAGDMKMLARWTLDLDLAVSDADPGRSNTAPDAKWRNQPDLRQAPLTNALLNPAAPNTLHPDGCYSEKDRAPGYFDRNNANGLQGLMSFWVKPNYHMVNYIDEETSLTAATTRRGRQFVKWSNYDTGPDGGDANGSSVDQFFAVGHGSYVLNQMGVQPRPSLDALVGFFGIGHGFGDNKREHMFQTPASEATRPHRWRLLTFAWDFLTPDPAAGPADDTGEMILDDGSTSSDLGSADVYNRLILQYGNDPTLASDITNDDRFGAGMIPGVWPHLIFLGRRGFRGEFAVEGGVDGFVGLGADATLDEFAIYDFGTGTGAVGGPAPTLALCRSRDGRYYKESAYTGLAGSSNTAARWYSAPIDLGGGRLIALSWTQVLPPGLRSPADPGEDGRIELELSDLAGTGYAPDLSGRPMDTTFRDSALSPVERTPSGPFRLHAVFRPNLETMDGTPILDPLALDDVTLLYEPPGGSRIRAWRDGAP